MKREKVLSVEEPDDIVKIDFMGKGKTRRAKDHRACTVKLTVEDGRLHVEVKGCDDRGTILLDTVVTIPKEDVDHE